MDCISFLCALLLIHDSGGGICIQSPRPQNVEGLRDPSADDLWEAEWACDVQDHLRNLGFKLVGDHGDNVMKTSGMCILNKHQLDTRATTVT